ncbi:MAG TPA: 50S ribosomal protein L18 [Bacteroidales bacterium]|nr:50S ribosomal protein L18 [Bacteroidales bacterium]
MAIKNHKEYRRFRIRQRIRKIVQGTAERPRMSIFRSNTSIYVQLIDDAQGKTLAAASSLDPEIQAAKVDKKEKAKMVGKAIAQKAIEAGLSAVVFDRGGYLYHGRVKSLADSAREAGLKF